MTATVRPAVADSGMSSFEVYDTPERLDATYPIKAQVIERGVGAYAGSARVRGVRFRSQQILDAFRERFPDSEVTVQT